MANLLNLPVLTRINNKYKIRNSVWYGSIYTGSIYQSLSVKIFFSTVVRHHKLNPRVIIGQILIQVVWHY